MVMIVESGGDFVLVQAKNLASEPFEPVSCDGVAAGGADGNTESRGADVVGRRIKTHYPLAYKALTHKHLTKVLAGDNTLRFTQKIPTQWTFPN